MASSSSTTSSSLNLDPRDRTSEFFAHVNILRPNLSPAYTQSRSTSSSTTLTRSASSSSSSSSSLLSSSSSSSSSSILARSEFTTAAALISSHIVAASEKLEKLTGLVRGVSLFNDPALEINGLVGDVKNDISSINSEILMLAEYHAASKSSSSSSVSHSHAQAVLNQLKSKLASTTKSFAQALTMRTKNLKEQSDRRKNFESSSGQPTSSSSSSSSSSASSSRRRPVNAFQHLVDDVEGADESESLLGQGPSETSLTRTSSSTSSSSSQLALVQQSSGVDEYYTSRAEAVENIESTIAELSQMYKQLVSLVQAQEETTITIQDNLATTQANVESGYDQLVKYFEGVSSDRMLIIKIFAILLVFIFFFMVFIA